MLKKVHTQVVLVYLSIISMQFNVEICVAA